MFFVLGSVCSCGKQHVGNETHAGTGPCALLTAVDEELEDEVRPIVYASTPLPLLSTQTATFLK